MGSEEEGKRCPTSGPAEVNQGKPKAAPIAITIITIGQYVFFFPSFFFFFFFFFFVQKGKPVRGAANQEQAHTAQSTVRNGRLSEAVHASSMSQSENLLGDQKTQVPQAQQEEKQPPGPGTEKL